MDERLNHKPSVEMPWTKYYAPGYKEVLDTKLPQVSLWKFLEEKLLKDGDRYDAFHYFGNHIKRSEVVEEVHLWARVMKGMGVKAGDEVVLFGPAFPETNYVLFAINMIGAVAILPNMFSAKEMIKETLCKARVAFVFIGMLDKLDEALQDSQFEKVVLMDVTRSMGFPYKQMMGVCNWWKNYRLTRSSSKYMMTSEAISRYGNYEGELEATVDPEKISMVFASSGTTLISSAKLIAVSNGAMLRMFRDTFAFNADGETLKEGFKTYCYLPPFAATAFYILMIAPLYFNMVVYLDPRLTQELFTKAMFKHRPQVTLVPGPLWEGFFRHIEELKAKGQKPDLSFLRFPIMGGEGCTPESLRWIDNLMRECGSPTLLVSGYGMSEVFSVATVDNVFKKEPRNYDKYVVSVGIPFPGVTVGVFDKDGNELSYGEKGEMWIKSPSMASGYYGNEELTRATFQDGWVHSNDLAEIDENGMVYIYGRMKQHAVAPNGEPIYLFHIANEIRQDPAIKETMACIVNGDTKHNYVALHLIKNPDCKETDLQILTRIDNRMNEWLPKGFHISGYKFHKEKFRSILVGKLDHKYYEEQLEDYKLPVDGKLKEVSFTHLAK